ncbi:MAG TPA: acetyl-CoA hydrolase/transferase C-terminal domain-containing protein [Spirochaetota bacterium]|nr:acetyl-CoA hydrolase/transferase C-terminal domain-containing protein [Spirochaetota bacterium]HQO01132.1 acetyl-CoA hydrolase/transferase C-terminal domain-containing protein [Spirochaetota bacterium]HQP48744.1 acetyl-CoA hydrolase/transferase C-terminal domain-containing protein [Spirochaetota bacterium]
MYSIEGNVVKKIRSPKSYSSWKDEYQDKLCSADEAASLIKSNDRIAMSGGTSVPYEFSRALSKRAGQIKNVGISMGYAMALFDYMKPENHESFYLETVFVGPMERICMDWGVCHYVPIHLGNTPDYCQASNLNIAVARVTPPDENGFMCRSNFASFLDLETIRNADYVIVEVNPHMPRLVAPEFKIHVSEVDKIIEHEEPIFEIPNIPISDAEQTMADYIAEMIPDGSCVQLGFGGLPNAIGYNLKSKKNLSIYSEVATPAMEELIESGAVNGANRSFLQGRKVVAGFCVGTRSFYDYVTNNKDFEFKLIGFINDPRNIAKNDNLVAINNALMLDLTGQVASESIGIKQYSGTGGQVQFIWGAKFAKNGKNILAINSTYTDKDGNLQTKIMPSFPESTVVTTSRNDVEYIVTEYGVTYLKYKSLKERAKGLISVAHPDFRDKLTFEAKKRNWL